MQQRVAREIELKLEIDPESAALIRGEPLPGATGCGSHDQLTIYHDTPDRILQDHGYTLRVRRLGDRFVQTIKPITASAGLLSRTEIEHEVPSMEPDLSRLADTPLQGLMAGGNLQSLSPVIRSEVHRFSWIVEVGGSRIQIDFDQGEMNAGGHSQHVDELELELLTGDPACLLAAAKMIADRVPVRIGVLSKAERGDRLASGAYKKITKAAPVHVDRSMTLAETFEVIVHACLKHYRLNEPLLIAKRKPEALHQTRVAMRRLRSAFTLFKPAIADVEYQFLREELRWFTSQLGEARNLDVYLERDLPEAERTALTKRRHQAYDQVVAAMNSPRTRSLMLELIGWTAFGPWRHGKKACKPVEHFASARLDRLWHSIVHNGHHIADLDEETRHRLRIQVKKMRYAIEFLRGLYPHASEAEDRFASSIEDLQESLGKLNDLATAQTLQNEPPASEWLIGEPEERVHLREAERAFGEVASVGPFWRVSQSVPA